MVNITYRHYEPGDEHDLADLYNISFQQRGGGQVRTLKSWIWRYAQSPGFKAEMCQIAEDTDCNKIVGAVYANLIEKIPLGGKDYLIGDINDVSCHPDYARRGIASNLMKRAIKYMKKEGCVFSILTASLNGFPRQKIYKKLGYFDFDKDFTFFQFPNLFRFFKDIYGLTFFFPMVFTISYLPRLLNRIIIKFNHFFKDFSYEIQNNKNHYKYMQAANRILPKIYEGFPIFNKAKFSWARMNVPSNRQRPTYISIKKGKIVVGGGVITHQNIYFFKIGLKIRIGIIHEIFIEKSIFHNQKQLHLGYVYLVENIMKAATRRNIGLLIYKAASKDEDLNNAFRGMNFFKIQGSVVMIKELKEEIKVPQLKKPLYIPTHTSFGTP